MSSLFEILKDNSSHLLKPLGTQKICFCRFSEEASDRAMRLWPDQMVQGFFSTLAERDLDRPKSIDRIAILFCHHPHDLWIQSIEALARVLEIETLLKDMLLLQSVQGVPYGPWRKICLCDDILLRQKAP